VSFLRALDSSTVIVAPMRLHASTLCHVSLFW
jgi:hypothetical protein